jgi:hypothetical protein
LRDLGGCSRNSETPPALRREREERGRTYASIEKDYVIPEWLKKGRNRDTLAREDTQTRRIVEDILADIEARGDKAVRELSVKFDGWDRADFRLTDREIKDGLAELSARDIEDIRFAHEQVRNFAQHQRQALNGPILLLSRRRPLRTSPCLSLIDRRKLVVPVQLAELGLQELASCFTIACRAPRRPASGRAGGAIPAARPRHRERAVVAKACRLIEDREEEPPLGLPRPSLSLRSIGPPSELEGY